MSDDSERRPIRRMPPDLALKIAAGEVAERPASVVKELIDNAIDSGAQHIRLEIREAGLKRIRVTDDGHGIPCAEVELAFASHATSKIRQWDDLEHLTTLGFRGEALASIAAVSSIEVQTRFADEPVGTRIRTEHGEILEQSQCSTPRGLRISVSDLFGNVPARRKFVRSLRAEGGQIQSVVMQYALAQPGVQFTLSLDGRDTFMSPGSGNLADVMAAVHGPTVIESLLPVDWQEHGIHIEGLISRPSISRSNRTAISVFANGRPIQNRSLVFALEEAYSGFLMIGRHPVAAVHLVLPPAEIDANIHPAKSEVRFARDREVHGALHRSIGNTLLEMRLSRTARTDAGVFASVEAEELPTQPALGGSLDAAEPDGSAPALSALPALRVFGQANQTFIIAEGPQGLYMIDQHAAHERVLFDRFDLQLEAGEVQTQPLLEPASVAISAAQMLALDENQHLLASAGFDLEPFGSDACLIRAVPALAGRAGPAQLVSEVLTELENLPEPAAARERALAAMACQAAVKAGATLDVQEMRELVSQLERTPRPDTCPHGRPTMIHLSHSQLEREFGRR